MGVRASVIILTAICCFKSSSSTAPIRVLPAPAWDRSRCSLNHSRSRSLASAIDFLLDHPCRGVGWRRVAFLDMANPKSACPAHLTLHTYPIRGCGQTNMSRFSCDSVVFPVFKHNYSEVYGRIVAYQKGTPEAFENYAVRNLTIESAYVDGISITHGPPGARQHIWTFAAARYEQDYQYNPIYACPCTNSQHSWPYEVPGFVKEKYFCDSGNSGPGYDKSVYYISKPLWAGQDCGIYSSCCQFNSPPWFHAQLPQSTCDDMELRLCFSLGHTDEDVIISMVELYVK